MTTLKYEKPDDAEDIDNEKLLDVMSQGIIIDDDDDDENASGPVKPEEDALLDLEMKFEDK